MSSQSDSILSKMKSIFGNEALIITSRVNDYMKDKIILSQEIDLFYEFLRKEDCPITDKIVHQNYLSCILYYHSFYNYKSKGDFQFIEHKLNDKCSLIENNFFFICNIIEFEDKYSSHNDTQKYEKLLANLNRFENSIPHKYSSLFLYYRSVLYFLLKDYQQCEMEMMILFSKLYDYREQNRQSNIIEYLIIANKLLTLRLKKECIEKDPNVLNEFEHLLSDMYKDIKYKKTTLAVKLGNFLADIYINRLDLKKSERILTEAIALLDQIKFEKSANLINQLYIILQSKLIYNYSFTHNIEKYRNEIETLSEFIQNEQRPNIQILNVFIINTYLLDIDKNFYQKEKNKEIVKSFIQCFFPTNQSNQLIKKFITNVEIIYNNLFALNHENPLAKEFNQILSSYLHLIQNKDKDILCGSSYNQSNIVNNFIYIYNLISKYTYLYLTNPTQNTIYKKEIQNIFKHVVNYISRYHKNMPSLKNNLVRHLLLNLYALYLSLCEDNFQKFVKFFYETFCKVLDISREEAVKVSLISKAIADNYFRQNNYEQALQLYETSLRYMKNEEEYRKGIVEFNIGICNLMLKNDNEAVKYLEKSLSTFTMLRDDFVVGVEKLSKICTIEFYEKKIQIINQILAMYNN